MSSSCTRCAATVARWHRLNPRVLLQLPQAQCDTRLVLLHLKDDALEAAIAPLPTDYAAVVRLMDLDGLLGSKAAERIGRSRGAVHMLRSQVHDRLRTLSGTATNFFSTH